MTASADLPEPAEDVVHFHDAETTLTPCGLDVWRDPEEEDPGTYISSTTRHGSVTCEACRATFTAAAPDEGEDQHGLPRTLEMLLNDLIDNAYGDGRDAEASDDDGDFISEHTRDLRDEILTRWPILPAAESSPADVSPPLDLVRQYGDARCLMGIGSDYAANTGEAAVAFARIAALLPQQPVQARDNHDDALWIHGCGHVAAITAPHVGILGDLIEHRDCRTGVDGPWRPLLVGGDPAPQQDGCGHGALVVKLLDITGVDEAVHLAAAVQNLVTAFKAAQSDPLVLSLPTVPEEAVALVGGKSGRRYTPAHQEGEWYAGSVPLRLGTVLMDEGSVRVEVAPPREPRTWPKLAAGVLDDLPARVIVERHGVWERVPGSALFAQAEAFGAIRVEDRLRLDDLRTLGDVFEVFDEPGGAR